MNKMSLVQQKLRGFSTVNNIFYIERNSLFIETIQRCRPAVVMEEGNKAHRSGAGIDVDSTRMAVEWAETVSALRVIPTHSLEGPKREQSKQHGEVALWSAGFRPCRKYWHLCIY